MKKPMSPHAPLIVSIAVAMLIVVVWFLGSAKPKQVPHYATPQQKEYAILVGDLSEDGKTIPDKPSDFPTPAKFAKLVWTQLSDPFYDKGPNNKGIGLQLGYSLGRVLVGYLLAVLVALPLGYLIGISPLLSKVLTPYIQLLKPISPLAWMPMMIWTD